MGKKLQITKILLETSLEGKKKKKTFKKNEQTK